MLVVNYHSIDIGNGHGYHHDPIYSVRIKDLRTQFQLLRDLSSEIVTLNDYRTGKTETDYPLALTFDDGHVTDYEIVYPLLKQYGFHASFFITMLNVPEKSQRWEQVKQMSEDGFTIGSHGVTHQSLIQLRSRERLFELYHSKKIIEKKIHKKVEYFALPGGRYNPFVIHDARNAGYKALLTTEVGRNNVQDSFLIKRWTVKRNTSLKEFEKMVCHNATTLSKNSLISSVKKRCQSILGDPLCNKINHLRSIW